MKKIKPTWVIFDAGGVLFNFEETLILLTQHLGINKNELLSVIVNKSKNAEISKRYYKDVWKEILSSLEMDDKTEEAFSILFSHKRYTPDTLLLVEELFNAGYHMAILTNTWHGVTEEIMSKLKVFQYFEHIFDSTEIGLRKPEPEIFSYVEKSMHAKENSIFLIDDNIININMANKFNWQTFHYSINNDNGLTSNNQIRQLLLRNNRNQ
ncbi:MAG: HAD-IA family hydrolase [Candidatus Daviesbacteria bacterium]|nr:HAD-IA family hydrolase [Candidatus Daviesbacteria bacterium]